MNRSRLTALAATLILTLSGCAAVYDAVDPNPDPVYLEPPLDQRPSMETVIADYRAMRAELVTTFATEFEGVDWRDDDPTLTARRSGCVEQDRVDGMGRLRLPALVSARSFDGAERDRAISLVQRIGQAHGFDLTWTVVDRETHFSFHGEDQYGGSYDFDGNIHSVFDIATGCHLWETPPDDTFTYPPDYPAS